MEEFRTITYNFMEIHPSSSSLDEMCRMSYAGWKGKKGVRPLTNPQGVLPSNMVLRATANDRHKKLFLCHNEIHGPRSSTADTQVALAKI
ncbi:hypothetical protein TNCV_4254071 [Trichonephila clavipes]|nr:hypothetical protein TNCV_4254071 [Trichonephila clavipes]